LGQNHVLSHDFKLKNKTKIEKTSDHFMNYYWPFKHLVLILSFHFVFISILFFGILKMIKKI